MFEIFLWGYVLPLLLNVSILFLGMCRPSDVTGRQQGYLLIWALTPVVNWLLLWIGIGPFCSNFRREFMINYRAGVEAGKNRSKK